MPTIPSAPPLGDDADEDRTKIGDAGAVAKAGHRDRAQLIVLTGESFGQMSHVDRPEIVIGRAADADIRLRDDGVSRRHARIAATNGEFYLEDLQSANGTLLNGTPVGRALLRDADNIQVGSTTVLKFTFSDDLEEDFRRRMYQAALYDPLTGACNKRHLTERMQTEVSYARRHGTPLSMLMLDIDHFKKINDTHGHLGGDHVLATLGQLARGALRAEDLFARYGGEEFAVLCRGTSADEALALGERLRSRVETFAFEHQSRPISVTVSIGIAAWFDQPESETQLVANADEALLKAKSSGRNRVVVRAFRQK
jgi:diguanylate cyclase (GGDEF)-like protein